MHALESVGLEHAAKLMPLRLSGGEQQRISIARALVREPLVILADEPTGNLDPDTSLEILDYLKRIHQKGITVIIGTHDYELVRHSPFRTLQITDSILWRPPWSLLPPAFDRRHVLAPRNPFDKSKSRRGIPRGYPFTDLHILQFTTTINPYPKRAPFYDKRAFCSCSSDCFCARVLQL